MSPATEARIERAITATLLRDLTDEQKAMLRCTILTALKEQDAATRHACAEAVSALAETRELRLFVDFNAAHRACMNAITV